MSRIDAAFGLFREAEIDALVVSTPSNIRYLCGFSGSNGTIILSAGRATLITDARYDERAREEIEAAGADIDLVIAPSPARAELLKIIGAAERVGIEADTVSWAEATTFIGELGEDRVVATRGIIESLRLTKDDSELESMRTAAAIADAALDQLLTSFGPGPTERDVARALDALVLDGGADGPAFDTIVASGPNASRPHHQCSNRPLSPGDLVIIDFGAEFQGYRSDMTRSFVLGEPSARQAEMLDGVLAAQGAGVDAVAAGVAASEIHATCRSHLDAIGLGEFFPHGTGHGVGLDIHEGPAVSAKATATLAPGHVITVEPGVYIPDFGGVRWEDTVVVTASGAEPLTRSAKQPIIS